MKPKFVLMVLLMTALAAGGITFLQRHSGNPVPAPAAATPPVPAQQTPAVVESLPPPAPPVSAPAPTPTPVDPVTPEERQASIEAEKERLATLEMNDDAASLANILSDLNSPEKEIRMAAIDAAVQFDSTNAIPVLQATAANDQDPEEKEALLKAADFIALPEVTFGSGNGH